MVRATLLPPEATTFHVDSPRPGLLALSPDGRQVVFTLCGAQQQRQYDATPEGQRFHVAEPVSASRVSPVILVLNWDAELRGR